MIAGSDWHQKLVDLTLFQQVELLRVRATLAGVDHLLLTLRVGQENLSLLYARIARGSAGIENGEGCEVLDMEFEEGAQ